jgi:hypothetical protein
MLALTIKLQGTEPNEIQLSELVVRRILGKQLEIYLTVPIVKINSSFDFLPDIKHCTVYFDGNVLFDRLIVLDIRKRPFFPDYLPDRHDHWYLKTCLKDIFSDYSLGPKPHNKVLVVDNLLNAFSKLNQGKKTFKYGVANLQSHLSGIKPPPGRGKKFNILQYRKNDWSMFEHLIAIHNQSVSPEDAITYTESTNGIGHFRKDEPFCDLTWLQANKNRNLLPVLEDTFFRGRNFRTIFYYSDYYKHNLFGHLNYARCISHDVNLGPTLFELTADNLTRAFRMDCPSFFQGKYVCEIVHKVQFHEQNFIHWNCSVVTLQDNNQVLAPLTNADTCWTGLGKITKKDDQGPWLKVELQEFESEANVADVYLTTPYCGDQQENKVGFHLIPEVGTLVLVKTSSNWKEPLFFDANLSFHPAHNKPHWKLPTLDVDLEYIKVKSTDQISLKSPGVETKMQNGIVEIA